MTILMIHAFLVQVGGKVLAVPLNRIETTMEFDPSAVTFSQGRAVVSSDKGTVEVYSLENLLFERGSARAGRKLPMIRYTSRGRTIGLLVDAILKECEIVVKPLKSPLELMPEYSGATILADGRIALILDIENLV